MSLVELRLVSREPVGPPALVGPDPDAALTLHELESDLMDLYETGLQPGISPGWEALRQHYTIKPGQFTVVTGIPFSGKSPLVNAMAMHCIVSQNWKIAWSSPEHLPYHDLVARLLQQFYKSRSFSDGTLPKMTRAEILQACDALRPNMFFLPVSEVDATIHGVLDRCKPLLDHGVNGLVIDPYGEFEHKRPAGMTETEYISQLLTTLRVFARKHAVHIWLVAHPKKMQKRDDDTYPVVQPYDIAGSSAFYNKPDNILSVYRDMEEHDRTQVHIQKVKFREVGCKGVAILRHDARTGTFYDLPAKRPA